MSTTTDPRPGIALALDQAGRIINALTTHGWDLATAIGRTDLLDEELARVCLPMIRQFVPAEQRGGPIPFAPVVDVPADAPVYDQLAGWMGRKPR